MANNDNLGDRMKGYEQASRVVLPHRMPVIVRVDGKAFHTYTRDCVRPFDAQLTFVMQLAAKALCEEIQGAQLAYGQSDEISVLVHNYKKFESQAWFDNQLQKMVSVAAATAAATFTAESWRVWEPRDPGWASDKAYIRPAVFDARAFVLPESDVCNYFLWRQQDAMRNSVQMLARSLYSHKQLQGKNQHELHQLCLEKGEDWGALPAQFQRGFCVRRAVTNDRQPWHVDDDIPVFSRDRNYINNLLKVEEG